MNPFKWFLIFALSFTLCISLVVGCDCGDDDDDDKGGSEKDENATPEGCEAEKDCFEETDECNLAAQKLGDLIACAGEGTACLGAANSCTTAYLQCSGNCLGDDVENMEACIEDCAGIYYNCYGDCGWDGDCMGDCLEAQDPCIDDCGLNFDCNKGCYTIYSTCMEDCF